MSLTLSAGIFFAGNRTRSLQGYDFKGVEYARAERFMPPKKKTAIIYGRVCPQNFSAALVFLPQDDACQNLNIWTAAQKF